MYVEFFGLLLTQDIQVLFLFSVFSPILTQSIFSFDLSNTNTVLQSSMRNILEIPLMDDLSLFLCILKHNGISSFLDGLYYLCFPFVVISHIKTHIYFSRKGFIKYPFFQEANFVPKSYL